MRWRTKVIKYYCRGLHLRWLRGFWLLQRFWLSHYCFFIQQIESILLQLRCMSCGSEGSAINTNVRWSLWHILDNMLFRCFLDVFYMLTASVMKELKEIRGVWKKQNILLHQLVQVKATSGEVHHYVLSLLWRTSLLYRNQPINLLGKSMEKFLYDRDLRHKRVYKSVLIKLLHIWLQQTKRNIPMLFVRGDGVILISPSLRVGV